MEKIISLNIIIYPSRLSVITMPFETGLSIKPQSLENSYENLSILVTKSYIENLGYLTPEGYWDFNWSDDRFVINGITYKLQEIHKLPRPKMKHWCSWSFSREIEIPKSNL